MVLKVPQLMTQCKGRKSLGPLEATQQPIRVYLLIAYKYAQKLRRYSPWPQRIYKRICERNVQDTSMQGTVLEETAKNHKIL